MGYLPLVQTEKNTQTIAFLNHFFSEESESGSGFCPFAQICKIYPIFVEILQLLYGKKIHV